MSLLQRVERAQRGVGIPDSGTLVPVGPGLPPAGPGAPPAGPGAPPRSAPPAGRGELLRQVRARLHDEVIRAFDSLGEVSGAADARGKVAGIVDRVIDVNGFSVTREERLRLVEEAADDLTGFGPLEPFLRDETVTEVMVNGPGHIYIERGGKIQRVESVFLSDEHVMRIIDRIITPMGRRIDESSPRVDARLPDGSPRDFAQRVRQPLWMLI